MFLKSALKGYEKYGDFSRLWKGEGLAQALATARALEQTGIPVSKDFVRCILQGSMKKKDLNSGKQAHALIIASGLLSHDFIAAELILLFASCHCLPLAYQVFHNLPSPSLYTCNAMISAQVSVSNRHEAICLYHIMCMQGINADKFTYLHAFKACSEANYTEKGRLIHGDTICCSFQCDPIVGSGIMDMYVSFGMLEDARKVFNDMPVHDAVSWGVIIAGHSSHNSSSEALLLFMRMEEEGHKPNQIIFSIALTACANIGLLGQGRYLHNQIIVHNMHSDTVLGNSLVDVYVKCGSMGEACKVFYGLSASNLATWSSLISGYAQQGDGVSALRLFDQLREQGMKLDKVTYLCLLQACKSIGAILHGMLIHDETIRNGLDKVQVLGSSILDMYVKCGYVREAFNIFNHLVEPDVISWSTIFLGFTQVGDWVLALSLYNNMQRRGMEPDNAMLASIVKACSQNGNISEAFRYLKSTRLNHDTVPVNEHYTSMVDLLSRSGQLNEAEDMLSTSPLSHDTMQLTSVLTSCRTHSNVKLGRHLLGNVFETDP